MTTNGIQIRDPVTGALFGVCSGPTERGTCPRAARNGVVPCAGHLIQPRVGDPQYWPVYVPAGYRHCEVGWHEQAAACMQKALACRRQWHAGLKEQTRRIMDRAAAGDPRYRTMTVRQVEKTAWWYWRLSPYAGRLSQSEIKCRERARLYLRIAEHRRSCAVPTAGAGLPGR